VSRPETVVELLFEGTLTTCLKLVCLGDKVVGGMIGVLLNPKGVAGWELAWPARDLCSTSNSLTASFITIGGLAHCYIFILTQTGHQRTWQDDTGLLGQCVASGSNGLSSSPSGTHNLQLPSGHR
jgi:hypothetical protein